MLLRSMAVDKFKVTGLNDREVTAARLKYGSNSLSFKKENGFILINDDKRELAVYHLWGE